MGHWGVKSYENDDADFAIDAGMERVHGDSYEDLMDDRNALSFDDAQKKLAGPDTLSAAVEALKEEIGVDVPFDDWDETERLAFAGIIVRHAEFGVSISKEWLDRAIAWLDAEEIEWDEATLRKLRRQKEIGLLRSIKNVNV